MEGKWVQDKQKVVMGRKLKVFPPDIDMHYCEDISSHSRFRCFVWKSSIEMPICKFFGLWKYVSAWLSHEDITQLPADSRSIFACGSNT